MWQYLTHLREHHVPAEVKPDAVEVSVEADLRQHGLPRLIGIIDLVQQKQIIDYKTSSHEGGDRQDHKEQQRPPWGGDLQRAVLAGGDARQPDEDPEGPVTMMISPGGIVADTSNRIWRRSAPLP